MTRPASGSGSRRRGAADETSEGNASRPSVGSRPEMWAGVECTVNRVGDRWFDQLTRNGHDTREDDIDRLAALGVRALRFPVLWERVAPRGRRRRGWPRPTGAGAMRDWTACARSACARS